MKKKFSEIKIGQKFYFKLINEIGIEEFIKTSNNSAKLAELINGCEFSYVFHSDEIVEI